MPIRVGNVLETRLPDQGFDRYGNIFDHERSAATSDPHGYSVFFQQCRACRTKSLQVAEAGLEPAPKTTGNTGVSPQGAADCGALLASGGPDDADLQAVIDAWPVLSEATKRKIMAIVGEDK